MKKCSRLNNADTCMIEDAGESQVQREVVCFYDHMAKDYTRLWNCSVAANHAELEKILRRLDKASFNRILEIGCGAGELSRLLVARAHYFLAIDVSPEMVKATRRNLSEFDPGRWAVEEADILALPQRLTGEPFDAIFFWGNGMTHIAPKRYRDFAAAIKNLLTEDGYFHLNLRDGREWIRIARTLDPISQENGKTNFVHIYSPANPKVGDMFECVIVSARCSSTGEISGEIISPPIHAYFNDCVELDKVFHETGLERVERIPGQGLTSAYTIVYKRRRD